ncbi:MAG: metal transporter, partial [Burkholderiales bacterium 12-64-5]
RAALLAERAALLDKAFRAGEGDLPELLRVRSAATQAQFDVVHQQAALGLARARVNQSLGLLP